MKYTAEITHDDDGEIEVELFGVGSSDSDREAIAYGLREAARLVETGFVFGSGFPQ